MARRLSNPQLLLGAAAAGNLALLSGFVLLAHSSGEFGGLSLKFWAGFCGGVEVALAVAMIAWVTRNLRNPA